MNFDKGLGIPNSKLKEKVTWEDGEFVKIGCKIHPRMRAWVGSVSSSHKRLINFKKRKKNYDFEMKNLPEGLKEVVIWMPGYKKIQLSLKMRKKEKVDLIKERKGRKNGTVQLELL